MKRLVSTALAAAILVGLAIAGQAVARPGDEDPGGPGMGGGGPKAKLVRPDFEGIAGSRFVPRAEKRQQYLESQRPARRGCPSSTRDGTCTASAMRMSVSP